MSNKEADPYTAKAEQETTTQQKVDEVFEIVGKVKTAMLTTRAADGALHARAMAPAAKQGLLFKFIGNNASGKFDEAEATHDANVSFYDPSSTDWVSVSGKVTTSSDKEEIRAIWNPMIKLHSFMTDHLMDKRAAKAWFGDLGDGKHTGEHDDPRVSLLVVKPSEIRYWSTSKGKLGQLADIAKGAVTGETAAPGVLRNITSQELEGERQRAGV